MRKIKLLFILILLCTNISGQTKKGYCMTTGGGKIYYEEQGTGQPLLLLHGHSLDMRMWNSQMKSFTRNYRTIRIDLRGYGRSSTQQEGFQFCHADDVITVLDSLNINKVHVVGLSMGAFIAGDILAMHTERLLSVTLCSGGIRGCEGPSMPMDEMEHQKRDTEISQLMAEGITEMKQLWHAQLMASGGSQRERMRKPLWQMIDEWSAWQPQHKESRLYFGNDAMERLKSGKYKVPMLLLRGEYDIKPNSKPPKEAKYVDGAIYKILPDCGHMMNMEQPELFNKAIIDFLKGL